MICKEIESLSRTQNIKSHFDSANHWYFRLKTIWAIIIHSLNGDLENQSLWKTSIPLKSLFPLINLTYCFLMENRNFKIDITSILPLLSHKNGALYGAQNYKHLSPKSFTFVKFWNLQKKLKFRNFLFCFFKWARGGRPATTTSRPSHILLIFSFEPPRNPRPSFIMCWKVSNSWRENYF